jgi:two-component system NtrC family sensor kinase
LAIEKNQHFAEMTVTDNGPGIPDENIEKIFDPFFSTKGNSGTGLGLSVVWGIVDEHGGTITVHSEINVGTTFVIRIPVYEATPIVKGGGDS